MTNVEDSHETPVERLLDGMRHVETELREHLEGHPVASAATEPLTPHTAGDRAQVEALTSPDGKMVEALPDHEIHVLGDATEPTASTLPYDVQIYDQLKKLFGTTSDGLVLEFPGRVLDPTTYAYPITGPYSALVKPQVVSEEEFRLTDPLVDFDKAKMTEPSYRPMVNGPSALQLSTTYEADLNTLIPIVTDAEVLFATDKERIRGWLRDTVEDPVLSDGTSPAVGPRSRMDIYEEKYHSYTTTLEQWRTDKEKMYQAAVADQTDPAALDKYARAISEQAQDREAQIGAVWDDLVARGYYHEVREALGFLDIAMPAELLEQAKAAMRQSGLSSIDETETIYPVQLQPTNWFTDLVSDFSPVDLLLDPDAMRAELKAKQAELDGINQQIAVYLSRQTGDPVKLQAAVDKARVQRDTEMTQLTNAYTQNTITAVKMYLAVNPTPSKTVPKELAGDLDPPKKTGMAAMTDADWQAITDGLAKVNDAQQGLTEAAGNLSTLLSAQASATVTGASATLSGLQSQASELTSEITALNSTIDSPQAQASLKSSYLGPDASPGKLFDPQKTTYMASLAAATSTKNSTPPPSALLPAQVNGNWETVIVHASGGTNSTSEKLTTASSTTSFDVDVFFGSASGNTSSADADATQVTSASNWDISLGMLAAKVTIDRGGWFQPGIFNMSADFASVFQASRLLTSYPSSFLVVKDVTIILSQASEAALDTSHVADQARSTSGGCLCFSMSSSSNSHDESHHNAVASTASSVVIRIPQPQILAWFVETVDDTTTNPYTTINPAFPPATTAAASPVTAPRSPTT
jgi:hypothetical protein